MELPDKKIQVGIVARQFLYRLGIKTILSVIGIEPEINEFNDACELKSYLIQNSYLDYALLSEDVFGEEARPIIHELKSCCPSIKLLVIGENMISNCPCNKFILHTDNQKEVLEKLQEFFFESDADDKQDEQSGLLSEREIDVLKNVALGFSNKQIADNLFISVNTVITHRKNITEKLGIKTIAGLTVYAIMNEIIHPDEVKF